MRWFASCASVRSSSARAAARVCPAVSRRIARTRTRVTATAAATSASRIAVAPAESGIDAATSEARAGDHREPEAAAPADLHDCDERRRQERAARKSSSHPRRRAGDEGDQSAAPEIEQDPSAAGPEPVAPRNDHRGGVAGGSGERRADKQPAVSAADIERELAEHDDDRHPAEPVADLYRGEPEAELDARVIRAIPLRRGTRGGGCVVADLPAHCRFARGARK